MGATQMGEFDRLAAILFEGDTVALDFKTMAGTDPKATRDDVAKVLRESMERMGLIVDGKLVNDIKAKS